MREGREKYRMNIEHKQKLTTKSKCMLCICIASIAIYIYIYDLYGNKSVIKFHLNVYIYINLLVFFSSEVRLVQR